MAHVATGVAAGATFRALRPGARGLVLATASGSIDAIEVERDMLTTWGRTSRLVAMAFVGSFASAAACSGHEPPIARPAAEPALTRTPAPPPPPPRVEAPVAAPKPPSPPTLTLVEAGPAWHLAVIEPGLVRAREGKRELLGPDGAWTASEPIASLPSFDVAGAWPEPSFASRYDKLQTIYERRGGVWRAVGLPPAHDLQSWVGGTAIGRAGDELHTTNRAFEVYGRPTSGVAYVPAPTPGDAKFGCPQRLLIDGFIAKKTGDFALWGGVCARPTSHFDRPGRAPGYELERFAPDGSKRVVALHGPGISFYDAWQHAPPSAASGPDSVWVAGLGGERWAIAHWNGTEVELLAGPPLAAYHFVGSQGARGAMAEGHDGTLWVVVHGNYDSTVWSRSPSGDWTEWKLAPVVVDGVERAPVYLRVIAGPDRVWFEARQWDIHPERDLAAVWSAPPAR